MADGHAEARPWLAHYPNSVPTEIDIARLPTLAEMLSTAFREHADKPAFESFGKQLTYGEMEVQARAVAGWLQAQGLKKGDRVAIMMPNVMAYPAVLFGTLLGGFTVVNVNPLYTVRELTHQVNDSGASILFVLENFAAVVAEALPHTGLKKVVVASAGDLLGFKGKIISFVARHVKKVVPPYTIPGATPFGEVIRAGRHAGMRPVEITRDDIAFLQYTGGTTGVSKGATLSHANVAANVVQCDLWLGWALRKVPDNVMVTALPLYHIFALTCCCLFMMRMGACCLLIANPRDIPGFIKILKSTRFTLMSGVNTLYNALANHPEIRTVDFSQLRFSVSGGMATQSAVAKNWKTVTGCAIVEGYGLSETSPVVTINRPDLEEFSGTIGYPMPSTDVDLRDAEGKSVPPGQPGEICVRGPQVMVGYWQRPDETAKVMTPDGYFRTGDIAVMQEDGSFRIVDRLKDMILVSGFNVYPNEVEEVIAQHPGVLEVAVIGVPDPQSTEAVAAYIVKKDPDLSAEAVRAHCRDLLTAYKVPKIIHFRDSLPKTNVGKVLRRMLRDEPAA
ncbi:AMP-binding protein [Rhabdaerophilum calidifontis]|uniref:AMP-binding protein n=1 Tax=Rhabdaerophilum calidifontis TaxID=2604328 RepID=UPI00123B331F|nr:AMP-binding protein [Rhabdaerophilum calidifontis]